MHSDFPGTINKKLLVLAACLEYVEHKTGIHDTKFPSGALQDVRKLGKWWLRSD